MDFSKISKYVITDIFEATDAEGVVIDSMEVTFDANKLGGEVERRGAHLFAERVRETQARFETKALPTAPVEAKEEEKAEDGKAVDWDGIIARMTEQSEANAITADLRKESLADALASDRYGIIIRWGMEETEGDEKRPMPPTFENMMRAPAQFLESLLRWCQEAANPKSAGKKKTTGNGLMITATSGSLEAEKSITPQHDGPPS